MTKPKAVIIDLDNCLALIGDRDPMHGHLCAMDQVCEATVLAVQAFRFAQLRIVVLTGRNRHAWDATWDWLADHNIPFHELFMRKPDDWRPAAEYKLAMLDDQILPEYDVVLALDDDPDVVTAFRSRGIVCWQVREPLPERASE